MYTAIGICHTGYADCLLEGSGWNLVEFHPDPARRLVMMDRKPVRNM